MDMADAEKPTTGETGTAEERLVFSVQPGCEGFRCIGAAALHQRLASICIIMLLGVVHCCLWLAGCYYQKRASDQASQSSICKHGAG